MIPSRHLQRLAITGGLLFALSPTITAQAETVAVGAGIDVLEANGFASLAGKKVGLITNHTGITRDGRRTVDVLAQAEQVDLRTLFSPEHGFAGTLDQSNIGNAVDKQTGLKVLSLYGKTRVPTKEMLQGLDVLVFDIQDIGCRFYTYISTMGGAMEAATAHDLDFVVLDRPNPIGGDAFGGPVRDPGDNQQSFVAWHTIPVHHGMTVGELAVMFRKERGLDLDLQVIRCAGWERNMTHDQTGLLWVNPSPNMRCLTQAKLYPGIGLIEFTNVSVGRGTDTPFEVVGAPWIEPQLLAAVLNRQGFPGVTCTPLYFTPDASKHKGERCGGVRFTITDHNTFDPIPLGFALALALRTHFAESWEPKGYDRLLKHDASLKAVMDQEPLAAIQALWAKDLAEFGTRRARCLLY